MATNDGGPAFPVECNFDTDGGGVKGLQTGNSSGWETGMTLRDWFAGQALVSMSSAIHEHFEDGHKTETPSAEEIADFVYRLADAMLAARDAS